MLKCFLVSLILSITITPLFPNSFRADTLTHNNSNRFRPTQLIVPTALVAYGALGLSKGFVQDINGSINAAVTERGRFTTSIDEYLKYTPIVAVYALNALGVEGRNRFWDRSILVVSSYVIMGATVNGLKLISNVERPNGEDFKSFPSGHTAISFMAAEFLWQEYSDESVWYGVAGYMVAASVGTMRILRQKHWLTDVAAGAGFGILSTKVAYWVYPWAKRRLLRCTKKSELELSLLPVYNGSQMGAGLWMRF